jgi:hypothetical protein
LRARNLALRPAPLSLRGLFRLLKLTFFTGMMAPGGISAGGGEEVGLNAAGSANVVWVQTLVTLLESNGGTSHTSNSGLFDGRPEQTWNIQPVKTTALGLNRNGFEVDSTWKIDKSLQSRNFCAVSQ